MTNEVLIVMYAIQAAARLGRKIQTIFEDEVRDRELILPPVEGDDLPFWDKTKKFFEGQGQVFVQAPAADSPDASETEKPPPYGLYHELWQRRGESNKIKDQLRQAHQRILNNLEKYRFLEDVQTAFRRPEPFYTGTNAIFVVKQWREGTDPKRHPVQRIAGTVVEIALDYVKVDPTLFSGGGIGNQITRAFLLSLDEVEFAESDYDDLLLDILKASLDTFRAEADMILSEDHLSQLLKQVSSTLRAEIDKAQQSGDDDKLKALYRFRRDMLKSVIRVSAHTIADNVTEYVHSSDPRKEILLESVLKAVLDTVQNESDLLSRRTLVDIYAAGLRAAAQNSALLVPDTQHQAEFLRHLIAGVAEQLALSAAADPPGIFTPEVLKDVIEVALDVVSENVGRLIDPDDPGEQLLVDALERVIVGLRDDFHPDAELSEILHGLFSRRQLVEITQMVFTAVAENPQGLLHGLDDTAKRSALAHIVGAVAGAVSRDTAALLNGDNIQDLLAVALRAFAVNPDRLLNLDSDDPLDNVMAQVVAAVVDAAAKHVEAGGRRLLFGDLLVDAVDAALNVVSKNVDGFLNEPEIVKMVVARILNAASETMANELDAENLLRVLKPILTEALKHREILDVSDAELILPELNASNA